MHSAWGRRSSTVDEDTACKQRQVASMLCWVYLLSTSSGRQSYSINSESTEVRFLEWTVLYSLLSLYLR